MLVAPDSEDRAAFQCLVAAHSGSAATELHKHLLSAAGSPASGSATSRSRGTSAACTEHLRTPQAAQLSTVSKQTLAASRRMRQQTAGCGDGRVRSSCPHTEAAQCSHEATPRGSKWVQGRHVQMGRQKQLRQGACAAIVLTPLPEKQPLYHKPQIRMSSRMKPTTPHTTPMAAAWE